MRQSHKTYLVWAILIVMSMLIWSVVNSQQARVIEVPFSDFMKQVKSGELENTTVEVINERDFVWVDAKKDRSKSQGKWSDEIMKRLDAHNVGYEHKSEDDGLLWQAILFNALPILLIVFLFFFIMRNLQSGGGKAMSFGKSKARLVNDANPKITFADVAGVEEAKEELAEIIDFLKDPKKFTRLGGRIPKGVLLMGPPGTGKTLLAKAIAGEAGVPFFSISGSDFVEMFVGVGASRVRDLFEQSKKHAPCIIFVDEIDAVGRHRGAGLGGGHDEREQTLNQLLVEMDGFEANEGIILIAATNRPDVLDPALLRPGRFDRRVMVGRPDMAGRFEVLKVHTKKVPLDETVALETIARGTPGFSGADLANLVNEAALLAARDGSTKVGHHDFENAKDKVLMGTERRSMVLNEKDKRVTAYHEAGHTLVAAKMKHADPVHKVSIIPRGRALGVTLQLPTEDRYNISKKNALDRIAICFGGRIAEDVVFEEITTGAGNDYDQATDMARKMVCEWGMSDNLGPATFGKKQDQVFLGRDMGGSAPDYSEQTAVEIDQEVRSILEQQYARAESIIREHRDQLEALAEALVEYETLEGKEILQVLAGKPIEREPPTKKMKTKEDIEKKFEENKTAKADEGPKAGLLGPLVGSES